MKRLPVVLLLLPLLSAAQAQDGFAAVRQQLKRYCLECHDHDLQKGGLDLERFHAESAVMADRNTWLAILDKVETGQMPPPGESRQPSREERAALASYIRALCARPDPALAARDPGRPPLRRLSRLEFNNTLRDLLGLTQDCIQMPERLPYVTRLPADGRAPGSSLEVRTREYGGGYPVLVRGAGLPGDHRPEHGYRNRGDAGSFSPLVLEQYLTFAQALVETPAFAKTPLALTLLTPAAGDLSTQRATAAQRWNVLLPRLFRRPATTAEQQAALADYEVARAAGQDFVTAMRSVLAARLASVGFLLRSEPVRPGPTVRRLDAYELANRVAYFLWASGPDAALLEAAADSSLLTPAVLDAQVRRLLRDPRSRELSDSFAVQWLRLDQLYAARPDREHFAAFYAGPQGKTTLHNDLLTEALLLFDSVRLENRSILDLVAAPFTWVNPRLAKHYGLVGVPQPTVVKTLSNQALKALPEEEQRTYRAAKQAEEVASHTWTRVTLDDRRRGGYLTMAAPLLVTSLPQRTSPVKRGAWLLETIFNRPPSEPKVAFSIDDDGSTAGAALSVRERLEAHRTKAACQSCHIRLDPPGFALEAFDPIGRWRERDGASAVDASGTWHGRPFDGPAQFKDLLLAEPTEFTRGFVEHLLSYALCRRLEAFDLPTVEAISAAVAADGHRFETVVLAIVRSYPFQWIRNVP